MPYGNDDPRGRLSAPTPGKVQPCSAPAYFDFARTEPEVSDNGSRTWWVRGQNFALAYTIAAPGEVLSRLDQPDEYVALFPTDEVRARICVKADVVEVDSATLVVIPPGDSEIVIDGETHVVRLFSSKSPDLLAKCGNHRDYDDPHANVTLFDPWPAPVDGHRVRVYRIADHAYNAGRFARIFRCSTFMVNVFDPDLAPRDSTNLSPHSHPDFEQASLAVRGEYVHHIRSPWTSDSNTWRDDHHVRIASPSLAIIPPPSIHTSQSVSYAGNQLVDIFCPPRHDFSTQPGWVINAAEYPMPTDEHS